MGNSTSCCGSTQNDYMKGMHLNDLEVFQRMDIPNNSFLLTIYDQFYRIVGSPFTTMHISEFIEDCEKIEGAEWIQSKSFDNQRFQTQVCSLKNFIKYFKNKSQWLTHIQNKHSVFLKLLFCDNNFIIYPNQDQSSVSNASDLNNAKVDLLSLKVWALLMAVGEIADKADLVFDMMYGPKTSDKNFKKSDHDKISWLSSRFIFIIRKIIYFSEIFPKKYLAYFGQKPEKLHGISKRQSNRTNPTERVEGKQNLYTQIREQPESWRTATREPYIDQMESKFDELFRDVFEDKFVDSIFPQYKSTISRENWIIALDDEGGMFAGMNFNPWAEGGMDFSVASGLQGTCNWIFSPAKIREITREAYFQLQIKKDKSIKSFRNSEQNNILGSLRSNKSSSSQVIGSIRTNESKSISQSLQQKTLGD